MVSHGKPLDIGRLVADHYQELYRYAYRLTGSAADAEDLTQQTFLVAAAKSEQVRSADCARSWLFVVLRNCYLKALRRRVPLTAAALDLDIEAIAQEGAADSDIDLERLQSAINELADEFKLVLLLFYFEERPYQEIAETLDIPLGTVMSRLSRAKGHLRRRLFESVDAQSAQPVQRKTALPIN